ncbi:collagen alpha-3(VI) chain [Brienomyrus brachyistius]|uniref:collagen alpha-3(VI) chain n=1 Tax=Brienomyrus brachyistius TaxID=42636 RepID=UPI0020B2D9FA|nr:collagen alpha-3(VI) chain [Brienomyrus brachyistius]
MERHWCFSLCAFMGLAFCGLILNVKAQSAQESADLVFLIDGSESVGVTNFLRIRTLALNVIERLLVGKDAIRVAVVQYSNNPQTEFELNRYESRAEIQHAVKGLSFLGGAEANLGAALENVAESLLGSEAGGRAEEGVPQALVVISAGPSSDDTKKGIRALKQANVFTFSVGIGSVDLTELEAIATDKSFVAASDITSAAQLRDVILSFVNGVAQRTIVLETDITEALAVGKRDIIFLIDGSQNMGGTQFIAIRQFIMRFVDSMPIGRDQVQVGVAQFTTSPKAEIHLNAYGTKEALSNAVNRTRLRGGTPEVNLGAALNFVRTQMLRPDAGSRIQEGVPQLLLVLSAKKSSDDVTQPVQDLQQMGVLIMAVGSKAADEQELKAISINENLVFIVKDFRQLLRNPKFIVAPLSTLSGVVVTEVPTETVTEITTVQTQRVVRDIVFLVDGSNYVGNTNLQFVREFITSVVNHLDVRPDRVQIALMQFAGDQRTEFYLNTHSNKQDVLNGIAQLRLMGGSRLNTGAAMEYALQNHFQPSAGSRRRQGVQQVLVLITGGEAQDAVKQVADKLALAGVLTFAVGAGPVDQAFLQTVAFVPDLAYYRSSFPSLPNVVTEIMKPLITVVGDTKTEEGEERDVAFLIDGSDAVASDFPHIKDFILKVIEPLHVGINKVRISVVQYSENPKLSFYLNTYPTKEEVISAINGLTLAGGRSLNTGEALSFMKDIVFSSEYGSRISENVPQFLIVLTGGRSQDNVRDPAIALKTKGVVPFGVGVKNADRRQIEAISHNPTFAFNVKDFSQLNTVHQRLGSYVSLPKESLAAVLQQAYVEDVKKDVVFLVDGSDGTRNGFSAVQDFVQTVVEKLNVEGDKDRVSVVQYSQEPEVNFYLNTFPTKGDVLDAIRNLRHKGGRAVNTGAALQFVRDNIFTASSGSRRLEGVPQILILLSGGRSEDDIRGPVRNMKEMGIFLLSIGTRNADTLELQTISHDPKYTVSLIDFDTLPAVQQEIIFWINEASHHIPKPTSKVIESARKDVVFLLDGSDNTRNTFEGIRRFVQRIVENLNVDDGSDQVAVVQYSKDAEINFDLKSFSSKNELLNSLKSIVHKGGRDVKMGAALEYVRESVFSASSGSRHADGVPQMLLVLSGGRSSDDIRHPAQALRESKIKVFGIGMRKADVLELQTVASTPGFAFSVSDAESLENIQPKVSSLLNDPQERLPTAPTLLGSRLERDIVFLIDGSDDSRNRYNAIRTFMMNIIGKLDVDQKQDQVAVVQYSNTAATEFYLNTHATKESILNAVRSLKPKGGRPQYTGTALQFVKDRMFLPSAGSRRSEGAQQILVLVVSGRSRDSPRGPAEALKSSGVVTFALGSGMTDPIELQSISFQPDYAYFLSDFNKLPEIEQNIEAKFARSKLLEEKVFIEGDERIKRDIVFLLDGSDNNRNGFTAMRTFVRNVVESLNVEENKDRVALVQFSNVAVANFYLNSFFKKENVLRSIQGLSQRGGRAQHVGAALQFIKDNIFTTPSGSRRLEGVPQMLILLSAGKSTDNVDAAAAALKELGVFTFGIGSKNADTRELQKISYEARYAQSVSDFNELPRIQEKLLSSLDAVVTSVSTEGPTVIVDRGVTGKDVVLLLDGSDGTRNGFPAMRDFVQRVVDKLKLEEKQDRVSVVQYSGDPTAHFYLNTYQRKGDILDAVRNLRHKGGRAVNTGAALQFIRDNILTAPSGSRRLEGVPQILILLSGAKTTDNVDAPAAALKELGVLTFGIGSRNADSQELQKISYEPRYAQSVSDFNELPRMQEQLLSSVDAVVTSVSTEGPTVIVDRGVTGKDVVFLLDGSDGTRNGFPAMRDFVQRVVDKLKLEEKQDRVSVVQYSGDPTAHFYLNTYQRKGDILDAVRNLRHKGGRAVNTGAALQFIRDNILTAPSGSRRLEGVPQILILLSGAKSTDNVDAPAAALKELGVLTFGIGSRNADSRELQKISYEPRYAQSVSDFNELPRMQEQLLSSVDAVVTSISTEGPTGVHAFFEISSSFQQA